MMIERLIVHTYRTRGTSLFTIMFKINSDRLIVWTVKATTPCTLSKAENSTPALISSGLLLASMSNHLSSNSPTFPKSHSVSTLWLPA
jgi:hypothetical protein